MVMQDVMSVLFVVVVQMAQIYGLKYKSLMTMVSHDIRLLMYFVLSQKILCDHRFRLNIEIMIFIQQQI
jgi:hypothetical protein